MDYRTKITAEPGKQELFINREFDLPVELLFRAHTDPALLAQWMSNDYAKMTVEKLDAQPQGAWHYVVKDPSGKTFNFYGVIHDIESPARLVRTFQMDSPSGEPSVQLEFHTFTKLTDSTSKLTTQTIYRSNKERDDMIRMGMAPGANMAHDRLQEVMNQHK